ncbi:MAG: prepilin-type N-terminal cleavage/methylation domain-containing protein [Candidatus Saccharibacteria bacterium]|nr:prepilin-type N-terminal cleavage/methylation domain-containing protein [Candidatus Saccharibacteria bacterium]
MKKIAARGYTVIELVVVVAIIGVLAAITIVGYSSVQQGARNTQRSTGLVAVSESLEKYYIKNGEYPSCAAIVSPQTPTQVVANTLVGLDPTDLTSPTDAANTNSLTCADPTTPAQYGYVGGLTTYTLKYKEEGGGVKVAAVARHTVPSSNFTLAVRVDPTTPWGSVSGGGSFVSGATPTITAAPGSWYSFDKWNTSADTWPSSATDCYSPTNTASHTVTIDTHKTCVAKFKVTPVTAPSTPTVSQNTVGATTTWSWGVASCSGGNTPQYRYEYTIQPSGFDSGWVGTGTPSVALTTSTEGQTYDIAVQAQCANPVTTSAWSASSASSPYYRAVTTPTISATTASSTSIDVSWPANSFAISYTMDRSLSSSFTSPTTITQAGTTYTSTGLAQGTTYYFRVKTNAGSGSSAYSTTANATTTIDPCTVPVDNANTVGATTTWTWSAPTCPGGTSIRYQYRYTITPSMFDSGWTATAGTSVAFTTSSQGQTYNVALQAQAYIGGVSSAWTASDNDSYYRPNTYLLTINAGANGTVNAGGTYDEATNQTITATPNTYYSFSSWTGSTGCSGIASHTILMDAAKTCTANFTPTPISAPSAPTVSQNTVGATTTWSWGAVSCPGNSVRYQYRNTNAPSGFDSGWVGPQAGTTVALTTSTAGQTYTVAVQAQCYNTATSSSWSGSGSAGYYSPYYTLTLVAGTYVGIISGGGSSYSYNDTVTMTAGPVQTYYEWVGWSGDVGCNGLISHTITMNANKTCTAYADAGVGWYPGQGGMTGKWVYQADMGTMYQFKTSGSNDGSPQAFTGLDTTNPTYVTLINPQINTSETFAAYPAQQACMTLGGRLPTASESLALYNYKNSYGGAFNTSQGLKTAAEAATKTSSRTRNMLTGAEATNGKTLTNPVRCVKGAY